jgi:cyanate permease
MHVNQWSSDDPAHVNLSYTSCLHVVLVHMIANQAMLTSAMLNLYTSTLCFINWPECKLQGIAFPAVHSIISAAVPARHTSSVVAIVTAASYAGMAASAGAAPWIIENFSWPMVFYSFGASALLWLPFWLATSVPHRLPEDAAGNGVGNCVPDSQSRLVPESEDLRAAQEDAMELSIDNALAESSRHANGRDQVLGHSFGLDRAFWALVQRREVWAICVAQYCQSWGMYTLFNWLPTFFNEEVSGPAFVAQGASMHTCLYTHVP